MRTYPLIGDRSEIIYAFEIENAYINPRRAAKILAEIPGVNDINCRHLFASNPEIHITFWYMGSEFVVWEPYADNSRFWIGPKEPGDKIFDISIIEEAFKVYNPPFIRRVIGNILMLRFFPGRS